jgi:hypothetical protein
MEIQAPTHTQAAVTNPDNPAAQSISLDRALSAIGGAAAGLSAAALVASVLFEFGFFLALDIDLMRLAGLGDYVQNAVVWFPGLGTFFLCYAALTAVIAPGLDSLVQRLPRHEAIRFSLIITIILLACIILLGLLFEGPLRQFLAFVLLCSVSIVIAWSIFFSGKATILWIGACVIIALGAVNFGLQSGVRALRDVDSDRLTTVRLTDGTVVLAILLRSYSDGILWREYKTTRITFQTWDEIDSLTQSFVEAKRVSLSCRFIGFKC